MVVICDRHEKCINILCGYNAEFLVVNFVVCIITASV
jgi:hypothetical protein